MPKFAILPFTCLAVALLALPAHANPALECGGGSQEEVGSCVADDEEGWKRRSSTRWKPQWSRPRSATTSMAGQRSRLR